jgi:hypothetical protein
MSFLVADTAMFNGRSPRWKLLPTGVTDHPLGSRMRVASMSFMDWLKRLHEMNSRKIGSDIFPAVLIRFILEVFMAELELHIYGYRQPLLPDDISIYRLIG